MELKIQKRLVADIAKCSPKRVRFDTERLADIKESITKADIKGLISDKAIVVKQKSGISKARTRKTKNQKKKGRQKGHGSRKGKQNARSSTKEDWKNRIRKIREFILDLQERERIESDVKKDLYKKAGGGFFRNLRHAKTYIQEHQLMKKK